MSDYVDLERRVAGHIAGEGISPPSDAFYDELLARAARTPQRPAWLALLTEAPMRTSRHLAVGSPAARFATIVAATLLISAMVGGAGLAGARILGADRTIVVDQSGEGTVTTISEAVAMADDGDTIRVRPGTYVEAIVIDMDVTIRGDGPRADIVLEGPPRSDGIERGDAHDVYAVRLVDSSSTIAGLTFRGERARLHAIGGSPLLKALAFEGVGLEPFASRPPFAIRLSGGTRATVDDVRMVDRGGIRIDDASTPRIVRSLLIGGPTIMGMPGDATLIRENTISGTTTAAIDLHGPTTARIELNTIADVPTGILLGIPTADASGIDPAISGNTISRAAVGAIRIGWGALPLIERNTLTASAVAIAVTDSDPRIVSNDLRENVDGIVLRGGSPTLEDNTIVDGTTGLLLRDVRARPILAGNVICGNAADVRLAGAAEMPDRALDEPCPTGPVAVGSED